MTYTIIPERLAKLAEFQTMAGRHEPPTDGPVAGCAAEIVSHIAGEPWSDHPDCMCRVIGAFLRPAFDNLPTDADRRAFVLEFSPLLVNTRATADVETRRGFVAADAAVRVFAAMALDAAGMPGEASKLRAMSPIVDRASARAARAAAAEAASAEAASDAAWAAKAAAAVAASDAAWAAKASARAASDAAWAAKASARAARASEAAAEITREVFMTMRRMLAVR